MKISSVSYYIRKFGRNIMFADSVCNVIQQERCILSPLRYKNKMYLEGIPTDIGVNDSGYYLLIAPPSSKLESLGDKGYLCDGERKYHIDRMEKFYLGDEVLYVWAVVKEHTDGKYPQYNHFIERR